MTQREPVRHAAARLATAMVLLSLLGTAGCMTTDGAVTNAGGDVGSLVDPTIDPVEQATNGCQEFSCNP